jgi:general stress protein 26
VSRRDAIRMSGEEVLALLAEERVVTCATHGPRGWPHLMPLWFVVADGQVRAWTFGASQKVRNLERDPRATLQVEAGVEYHELRGVVLECETEVVRDLDAVTEVGLAIMGRYAGGAAGPDVEALVRRQAEKRVGLLFHERHRATWDHRKLGGAY